MSTENEVEEKAKRRFHPLSGVLIIAMDLAFWGGLEAPTLSLAAPVAGLLAFCAVGTGVSLTQRFLAGDSLAKSAAKGFFGGVAAGVPTPIAGGLLGGLILSWSGLDVLSRSRSKEPPPD